MLHMDVVSIALITILLFGDSNFYFLDRQDFLGNLSHPFYFLFLVQDSLDLDINETLMETTGNINLEIEIKRTSADTGKQKIQSKEMQ